MSDNTFNTLPARFAERRSIVGRLVERIGKSMLQTRLVGQLHLTFPDGYELVLGSHDTGGRKADLQINSYAVIAKCLRRASVGFGEAYMAGDIDSSDLVSLFRFFLDNRKALTNAGGNLFKIRRSDRKYHVSRRNTISGSKKNIEAHYDLGNDFYALWLDETMTYSSALYEGRDITLAEAQAAKYSRALELMKLPKGQSGDILEIGCGWGGMAEHAAQQGHHLTGITLSPSQLAFAQQRLATRNLGHLTDLKLQDYRHTGGQYDAIVSIEMIEAVGEDNWPQYFEKIAKLLKPGGRAVIQAITISEEHFERYRNKVDFIQRYIFPGGMLPSETAIVEHASLNGLRLAETQTFGADYARTLREWTDHFNAVAPSVSNLGYSKVFQRMWLYYLAYCEAGFADGAINVGFYVLEKPQH